MHRFIFLHCLCKVKGMKLIIVRNCLLLTAIIHKTLLLSFDVYDRVCTEKPVLIISSPNSPLSIPISIRAVWPQGTRGIILLFRAWPIYPFNRVEKYILHTMST